VPSDNYRRKKINAQYYTARNATDLLQVADFTSLLEVVNKLQQAC
jgi:hypothetical protein